MSRALLLALALTTAACSTPQPTPAAGAGAAAPPTAPAIPPVIVSMPGEVNGMPSIAALGDRVVLVWTGTKEGVMSVYSAVSDDRGATFNVQRRVNDRVGDVSSNVEQPPRVAISTSGITVVWSSKIGGPKGASAIRMSRSTDGGRTFTPASTVHSAALTGARGWESIAPAADGSVHVVWLDGRNAIKSGELASSAHHMADMAQGAPMPHAMDHAARPPVRQDVFSAAIDAHGKVTETSVAANVCFCCKTAVAVGSHGQVFAAWRHIFPGSMRDIAMAVSSDAGRTFAPLARVSEDKWEIAGCPEDGPSIALDASDTAHLVWPTVVNEGQPQKVVFYASTKDGRVFSPRMRLSDAKQEEAAHPQIAVGASGIVAAVWDEPHDSVRQVKLRTLSPGGQWSEARVLNASVTGQHPVAAPLADGFLVAWTSGEGAAQAIVLQRVGVSPMPREAAKPSAHTPHTFRGKVEGVDLKAGGATINGEEVEGWMAAMTMMYLVENKDVLAGMKVGDAISATVYDGDMTLHDVKIAPR